MLKGQTSVPIPLGGFVGAYDAVPNLVHVYEPARRTLTSYTGPLVRIRRSSDNTESDFSSLANGDLDNAAITTFLGGSSPFVVTVYDQVGSNNPTQATAGNQPVYVASGQNGKPVMRFDGATDFLRVTYTSPTSQPISAYAITKLDVTAVADGVFRVVFDGITTTDRNQLYKTGADGLFSIYAGTVLNGLVANANWNVWAALINGVSSQFWLNAVSQAAGNAGAQNQTGITIGAGNLSSGFHWKGDIASVVIADPSHSTAEREAMQDAINDYWAVY